MYRLIFLLFISTCAFCGTYLDKQLAECESVFDKVKSNFLKKDIKVLLCKEFSYQSFGINTFEKKTKIKKVSRGKGDLFSSAASLYRDIVIWGENLTVLDVSSGFRDGNDCKRALRVYKNKWGSYFQDGHKSNKFDTGDYFATYSFIEDKESFYLFETTTTRNSYEGRVTNLGSSTQVKKCSRIDLEKFNAVKQDIFRELKKKINF